MIIQIKSGTQTQWYNEAIGQKFYAFSMPSFPDFFFVSLSFDESQKFDLVVHKNDCKVIKKIDEQRS